MNTIDNFRFWISDFGLNLRSVRRALQEGAEFLSRAGIESARLDAELLLGKAVGHAREALYRDYQVILGAGEQRVYDSLLERRARGEPLAYITGEREFWSLPFYVTSEVLVPRPETEILIEVTLELAKKMAPRHTIRILDLGTGSGAVAVALAGELGAAEVWATDLSARALEVARTNAARHEVCDKIRFLQGDTLEPVKNRERIFDLVVSNPPYVRRAELPRLTPEVRDWEPRLALDGGADGLDVYRRISQEAHLYLADGGFVALEIGADMGAEVCRLFAGTGYYDAPSVYQDYAGKDRVVVAQKLLSDAAPS